MTAGVRVKFEMHTPMAPPAVLQSVHDQLCDRRCRMSGIVAEGRIELYVPSERQHLWSPQLVVDVEPWVPRDAGGAQGGAGGSMLRGRFGPHPHVWALYLAMAAVTALATLFAISYAYAQWAMGQAPSSLWALPLAVVAWFALYAVAIQGQRWGEEQVLELRAFLEQGLKRAVVDPSSVRPDGVFTSARSRRVA